MSQETYTQKIIVIPEDYPKRLDIYLAQKTAKTRSSIQKMIEAHRIKVNNSPVSSNYKPKIGDEITIIEETIKETTLEPEPIHINIFYRDDYIVVVDKPSGMVVYPSIGHNSGTLINAIYYHCKKVANAGLPLRPGIVHRLDKDTSGVMVVALDDIAYYRLVDIFRNRQIERQYRCIVSGRVTREFGSISFHIGRSEQDRKKMSIKTRKGKVAITQWNVIERFASATYLGIKLGTGRTHQIRVHMSAIGHPVLGDRTYGKKTQIIVGKEVFKIDRQMLHAAFLGFDHPITGKRLEFKSPLPDDILKCLDFLRNKEEGGSKDE
ncbi:MAG: RluA family pseudouridine synthase [Thermodesulfovibrionales bacterium]